MRKHTFTLAALLVALAPLTAAAQGMAQGRVVQTATSEAREEGLPSIADEVQGMEPVYAPGNHFGGPYSPGPYGPDGGSCGCGCQSCEPQPCCESCCDCCQCCCCGPTFEVRAAGVVLRRNDPGNVAFLIDATGASVFNFSQFDFDYEPGVDASVIGFINPCVSVEARYLGLFDVSDEVIAPLPATTLFVNTTPLTLLGAAPAGTTIDATYRSELHSGEINLRGRATPWLNLFGGFRYLNLREHFDADIAIASGASALLWNTRVENNLYGLQLGAEGNLIGGGGRRYSIGGFAKGGIFVVQADHDVSTVAPIAGTGPFQASASDSQAAFVTEAGVNASFQVTRYLSVTAGYQILWLDRVAVASDQIPVTGAVPLVLPVTAPTGIDVNGHVLYHGAKLGFDFRY